LLKIELDFLLRKAGASLNLKTELESLHISLGLFFEWNFKQTPFGNSTIWRTLESYGYCLSNLIFLYNIQGYSALRKFGVPLTRLYACLYLTM
jgi:hypothetical protein